MKKQDLYNGDIVQLRNGDKYILLKNIKRVDVYDDLLISLETSRYIPLNYYDDDLYMEPKGISKLDIVKVCSCAYTVDNIRKHIVNCDEKNLWTWEKEDE